MPTGRPLLGFSDPDHDYRKFPSMVRSDGEPLGLRRGLLRAVIGVVSAVVTLGLGFYLTAFDGKKRALYDVLAGTVVIRTR